MKIQNVGLANYRIVLRGLFVPVMALSMAACEVSESPSSGSVEFSDQAGTYKGMVNGSASAPGFDISYTLTDEPITITISNNGNATVEFMGQKESRYINGKAINVTLPVDESYDGYTCTGQVAVSGQFTENNQQILGAVSGDGTCSNATKSSPITIRGEVEANK